MPLACKIGVKSYDWSQSLSIGFAVQMDQFETRTTWRSETCLRSRMHLIDEKLHPCDHLAGTPSPPKSFEISESEESSLLARYGSCDFLATRPNSACRENQPGRRLGNGSDRNEFVSSAARCRFVQIGSDTDDFACIVDIACYAQMPVRSPIYERVEQNCLGRGRLIKRGSE